MDEKPDASESRARESDNAISMLIRASDEEVHGNMVAAEQRMRAAEVHAMLALAHAFDQLDGTIRKVATAYWKRGESS